MEIEMKSKAIHAKAKRNVFVLPTTPHRFFVKLTFVDICSPILAQMSEVIIHQHSGLRYYRPKRYCLVQVVQQGGGQCISP